MDRDYVCNVFDDAFSMSMMSMEMFSRARAANGEKS